MNVVPFGKYKGQPLEIMAQDKQYLDWLQAQSWFIEKYQQINTWLISNNNEPAETPEHNKLQSLFTNDGYIDDFLLFMLSKGVINQRTYDIGEPVAIFEKYGFDVVIKITDYSSLLIELKPEISDDFPAVLRQVTSITSYTDYSSGRPFQCTIQGTRIVLTDRFSAVGANFDQVVKMYNSRYVYLFMLNEI